MEKGQMQFQIQMFQSDDFDPSYFVNDLIEKEVKTIKFAQNLEIVKLDQLNHTLENAIKQLEILEDEIKVSNETLNLEKELNYTRHTDEHRKLLKEYDTVKGRCDDIEGTMLKLTEQTINIGKQLEKINTEKSRDQMINDLVVYIVAFNQTDKAPVPGIFTDPKQLFQAADYLYLMNSAVKNLSTNEYSNAIQTIKRMHSDLQQNLLSEFNEAYYKNDYDLIRKLLPHVENYEIFDKIANIYITNALRNLRNFNYRSPESVKSSVDDMFFQILRIFKIEFGDQENLFFKIFESKTLEMTKQFLSFIFDNYINKTLSHLLYCVKDEVEQYLEYYLYFYEQSENLINEIYKIESPHSAVLLEISKAYLTTAFDEHQQSYANFELLYVENTVRKAIDRIRKILKTHTDNEDSHYKLLKKKKPSQPKKISGKYKKLTKTQVRARIEALNEVYMQESIEFIFKAVQVSVKRITKLAKLDEKSILQAEVLSGFLEGFGNQLLVSLLEFTIPIVPELSRKSVLNENYWDVISRLNSLVQRMELVFYASSKEMSRDRTLEKLENSLENCLQFLERNIHTSIQDALASLYIHCNKILVYHQKKEDYRKSQNEAQNRVEATKACQEMITFTRKYVKSIKLNVVDTNRSKILNSLGVQLVRILIDHLADYKVNAGGSLILGNDIAAYSIFFEEFEDPGVNTEFLKLKYLANIHKTKEADVKAYIKNRPELKGVAQNIIDQFVANRRQDS